MKFGVPSPVIYKRPCQNSCTKNMNEQRLTGSHPTVALKPFVEQPGFEPIVMSFNPRFPLEYNQGFKKPKGLLPQAIRWSFKSETTDANV